MTFEIALTRVAQVEGGYTNSPADSGGETMYGITATVARANGYAGAMRDMPFEVARSIYRLQYWDTMRLDHVARISERVADELFEAGVSVGVARAAQWLQRCLNVFNRNEADYSDVKADGVIGPITLNALRRFYIRRGSEGERVLVAALNALQGSHYITLAEAREKDEAHVFGWILRRVA